MAARWRVIDDQPLEDLGPDGRFTSSREIRFEILDSGRQGSVKIPLRSYEPDFVQAEIQRYADRIESVANLGE